MLLIFYSGQRGGRGVTATASQQKGCGFDSRIGYRVFLARVSPKTKNMCQTHPVAEAPDKLSIWKMTIHSFSHFQFILLTVVVPLNEHLNDWSQLVILSVLMSSGDLCIFSNGNFKLCHLCDKRCFNRFISETTRAKINYLFKCMIF